MQPVAAPSAFPRFSSIALTLLSVGLWAALPAYRATAQDQAPADIETARNSVAGIVNANGVPVRSSPTDSAYSTTKLNKGDRVTVVGTKLDWLKIVPPEGSFCYIGKLYVDRHGDGTQGRINKDKVNIRAGSEFNTMAYAVLCEAPEGIEVTILGEHDEYFKIKPPPGAFLYVNSKYVDHDTQAKPQPLAPEQHESVVRVTAPQEPVTPPVVQGDPMAQVTPPQPATPAAPEQSSTTNPAGIPAIGPSEAEAPAVTMAAPTTQSAPTQTAEAIEALFAKSEVDFAALNALPIEQQAVAPLIESYQLLAASDKLAESLRRVAENRVATLKNRTNAVEQLAQIHKELEEKQHQQLALNEETKELQERLAKSTLNYYTALGELHPSSLQMGPQTLYRLTDPGTGRTVCYLRTGDAKFVKLIGQFVGVKGDLANDDQLGAQVVAATAIEAVDPAKVNNGVAAQIVPPSLMPKAQANGY